MDPDSDSWEANAQYMLDRCPYTVWQRLGEGPVDLKSTLVATFQAMQMRLEGHPMYARKLTPPDDTALLRQALEALRMCRAVISNNIEQGRAIGSSNPFFSADVANSIAAIRTRLEETK